MDTSLSDEVILISPRRISDQNTSPNKKRKIVPSPESSASKKLVIISPYLSIESTQPQPLDFSPSLAANLFPAGCAEIIEARYPFRSQLHGHPQAEPTSAHHSTLPSSRQVILPFNLRDAPAKFFEQKNSKLLFDVFPGTKRVDFDDRVLVYHFNELPAKPWPKKVAGVPCYLTADPDDQGPMIPMRQRSRSRIALSNDLDLRGNEGAVDLVFELVREFFAKSQISITEIQFWGRVIVIVLENESNKEKDLAAVPRSIGQCNCFYLFESDMARPKSFSTAPLRQCFASQIDDSEYETIRPGVVVSSGTHPQEGWEILTSSGILISDHLGSQYMTVAAHGFPGPFEGKVFHPQSSGRAIGEVIVQISHTDVALVQLGQGVHFINEPFENTIIPAPPSRLEGFLRAAATRIGGNIFMDSPFSGFMEGTRGAHSLLRIPSDDPLEPKQSWIRCQWDYMGQGSYAAMVDGVHGSAIWDDNQNVLGFFRYAPQSGPFLDWCMSISADHLLDKGYTMV